MASGKINIRDKHCNPGRSCDAPRWLGEITASEQGEEEQQRWVENKIKIALPEFIGGSRK